jgi:pimeloyl-ACP methyl ester carboxylesterase
MKNNKFPPRLPSSAGRGRLLRNGLLLVLGLGAASALGEHILELRDTARLTASETFYTAHGRRIRYHQTGPSTPGPTVVLLNGIAGSLEQWDEVQSALSRTLPVLSYDRSGAGFSDPADGHDAYAGAAELDQLLHDPQVARPPFLMVGFSSSAMLAIVFAATHRDVVKGIVLVDPILRTQGPKWSYRRIFLRPSVVNPIEAFFGYTRLKSVIADRNAPPSSPKSERWQAIIQSTHHWVATTHDAFGLDESADEADALMAARPFAELPLGEIITDPPDDGFVAAQKEFVSRSDRGIIRAVHYGHSELLTEPGAVAALVDLIHAIADQGRSAAVVGGSP